MKKGSSAELEKLKYVGTAETDIWPSAVSHAPACIMKRLCDYATMPRYITSEGEETLQIYDRQGLKSMQ